MEFIELTFDGEPTLINVAHIIKIEKNVDSNIACIYLDNGHVVYPEEDYYTIKNLISK